MSVDQKPRAGELLKEIADLLGDVIPASTEALEELVQQVRERAVELERRLADERLDIERIRNDLLRALEEAHQRELEAGLEVRLAAVDTRRELDAHLRTERERITEQLASLDQAVAAAQEADRQLSHEVLLRLADVENTAREISGSAVAEAAQAMTQMKRELQEARDDLSRRVEETNGRLSKVFVSPPPSSIQVKKDGVKIGERRAINFLGSAISVADSRDGVDVTITGGSGTGAVDSVNGDTGVVVLTQDDIGDGTTFKQYSGTEQTKLAGIAAGATVNSPDATLLARANHTGTQAASTISDFSEAVDDRVATLLVAGSNVSLSYDDVANTLTIAATDTTLTTEQVQDIVGALIADTSVIDATYDDAGNVESFTIAAGSVTNAMLAGSIALSKLATDPLARANHTGTQTASTISNFDTQVRTSRLDQMATPTAAVAMGSQRITGLSDPSSAQDAATKAYVDALGQGLSAKDSVRVATTAAGTLASSFENGDTVDGVVLATGDRILIKNQAAAAENGIYTVNASGAPTRTLDFDSNAEVAKGAYTFVEEGTTNADSGWVLQTDGAITIGTTGLAFTQFSGAGQITDGAALLKTGNTLDVRVDNSTIEIASDLLQLKDAGVTAAKLAAAVAGDGLTGGAGSALAVGAGTGISVAADSVSVTAAVMMSAVHGSTAGTARPTGPTVVIWIGSVTPTNAIDGDLWIDTT